MIQNLINHVGLAVDKSGSMGGKPVVRVVDAVLQQLKQRSVELNQETRISIYLFDNKIEVLTFDMDVMRFKTLEGHYQLGGSTALIDAMLKCVHDHQQLPEMYGDHAFLMYAITDGENNENNHLAPILAKELKGLKENWTVACQVPNATGVHEAKKFGFPAESIAIWDVNSKTGLEEAATVFTSSIDRYMVARASGVRSSKSFFTMDSSALTKKVLDKLDPRTYEMYPVFNEAVIKDYVESFTKMPYRLGSTYYMPTKKVKIQDHKNILVQDVKSGTVYQGDNLRQLLGLPVQTAEVDPGDHKDWRVLVQSTSLNRKLFPGTFILVMK